MFFVLFNVAFLLLLKHKCTNCVACGLVRVRHTPFPGQSECFVAVILTLFDPLTVLLTWMDTVL